MYLNKNLQVHSSTNHSIKETNISRQHNNDINQSTIEDSPASEALIDEAAMLSGM